jgi:hypothetical protein
LKIEQERVKLAKFIEEKKQKEEQDRIRKQKEMLER